MIFKEVNQRELIDVIQEVLMSTDREHPIKLNVQVCGLNILSASLISDGKVIPVTPYFEESLPINDLYYTLTEYFASEDPEVKALDRIVRASGRQFLVSLQEVSPEETEKKNGKS
jgi:hypothetical protein